MYILGYRFATEDPDLHHIRDAVLSNFLVAIDSGHLEIRGRSDNGHWVLNRENLADTLDSTEHLRTQIRPYYLALRDPEPVIEIHPKWGRLRLFIYQDDSLPRPLWTWGMRKPLMKVREFRTTSISVPFAAVLIADGDEVNEKLRNIEPPRHNDWEPGRAAYGRALLEHLWDFVRRGLRARLALAPGRTVRVTGLSRFLPAGGGLRTRPTRMAKSPVRVASPSWNPHGYVEWRRRASHGPS